MRVLGVLATAAVATAVIAACGGGSSKTTTVTSPTPATTSTTPATSPGGHPAERCGSLTKGAGPAQLLSGRPDAEACFASAAAACRPAVLVYAQRGVDTGSEHTFTSAVSGRACHIADTVKRFGPLPQFNRTQVYICSAVRQDAQGLHVLGCGAAGDVDVPAVGA